jgi:hypothetical protein
MWKRNLNGKVRIFIVANKDVADPDSERIHGAAGRHTDIAIAGAAKILYRIEWAGFDDLDHSSILAGTKRTVSPGAIRAGIEEAGSNICSSA